MRFWRIIGRGSLAGDPTAAISKRSRLAWLLAKEKKVPKTFAVPCHVVDPATATEASLAENIIRVAMHPADQFMAFQQLAAWSKRHKVRKLVEKWRSDNLFGT